MESDSFREKYPYLEFFYSVFPHIGTKDRDMRSISLHSVQRRENTDQKNSEYRHFSCSDNSNKNFIHKLPRELMNELRLVASLQLRAASLQLRLRIA